MTDAALHQKVLAHAVESIGGQERPGQVEMADAVAAAISSGRHLLVQAGTGSESPSATLSQP